MSTLAKNKPQGFLRWLLRAPRWLYYSGLGWILGERFLMLKYVGRKSGLKRETVIEVIDHDEESDTYYVASGWGTRSDWFHSIRANPEVKIEVGRRKIEAHATVLKIEDATHKLFIYAKKHPIAFHELAIVLVGKVLKGTEEECRELVHTLPIIAFCSKGS